MTDWDALATAWQAQDNASGSDPRALRAHVDAETRRLRWIVAGEVVLSGVAIFATVWHLVFSPGPEAIMLTADVWAVLVIVWVFVLSGRRGAWRPSADTTQAYLSVERRRIVLRIRTAWLAAVLLAAQLLVVGLLPVGHEALDWARRAAVAIAWLLWAFISRRRALEHLRQLDVVVQDG